MLVRPLIKKPLPKLSVGAKPAEQVRVKVDTSEGARKAAVAAVADTQETERSVKSISLRLPAGHMDKLEELQSRLECDRTEVIKRAIRLAHAAFMQDEASLVTVEGGEKLVQPLVTRGNVV